MITLNIIAAFCSALALVISGRLEFIRRNGIIWFWLNLVALLLNVGVLMYHLG